MNTDNLDQLDDAELSGLFAEKVARLKSICIKAIVNPRIEHYTYSAPTKDNPYLRLPLPSFATSADAVLPWLNQMNWRAQCCPTSGETHHPVILEIWSWHTGVKLAGTYCPTFARAACIALMRAKRPK